MLLAGSAAFPHQAFRVGRMAYGVQFHLEVSREMAAAWAKVPAYSAALDRVLGPGALEGLLEQMDGAADGMRSHGRAMFEHWLDLIPQRGYGEPSRGRR